MRMIRSIPCISLTLALAVTACTSGGDDGGDNGGMTGPVTVASITVSPTNLSLAVGASQQITAQARDASGNVLAGRTITYTSGASGVAQADASGNVLGVSPGNTAVTVASGGVSTQVPVQVALAGPLAILQVSPALLVEGQAATITGTGFSPVAAANSITIDGIVVNVTQATTTSLQFTVPETGCRPRRTVPLQVRLGAETSNTVMQEVTPASFVTLAVGEMAAIQSPADRCLQFAASAAAQRYVFGVQSVSQTAATLTPVTVASTLPAGATTSPPLAPAAAAPAPAGFVNPAIDRAALLRWQQHIAATADMYERNAPMFARLQQQTRALAPVAAVPTVPETVQEGQDVTIRFPNFSGNTCELAMSLPVRVRRITNRAIFLEDQANPVLLPNADFDAAGAAFELSYNYDVDNFGAPGGADGTARVVIVMTKEVNRIASPPLGFVSHGDRFPVAQCAASNEVKMIYLRGPDPTGLYNAGVYSIATLNQDLTNLLLHEFAHIIQSTRRNAAGGSFMASWLEEGLATAGQEIGGFQFAGLQDGMNYGRTVAYNTLGGDPRAFFHFVSDYLGYFGFNFASGHAAGTPEECTWVGSTGSGGNPGPCSFANRILYGVPWSLIKHTIDRRLGGPAMQKNFLRAFSDYTGAPGFPALQSVLGMPVATMMAEWAPVLYIDDRYPAAVNFQLRNWNLRDIAAAWNTPNAELIPRMRAFDAFNDFLDLRAGSSAYYEISGANRPATAVRFRDGSNNPLPDFIQIWIVRVQ